MCDDSSQITDLFETKKVNSAGIYLLYLYVNGIRTPVIIDDYFPCYKSGKIAFCKSQQNELWAMLIEKAWAKLHGTFVRTEGNLPCFAYSHLTGVPSSNTSHESVKNKEKFFQELVAANLLNNILIASSGDKKSEK